MIEMPKDGIEFQAAWHQCAGAHAVMHEVVLQLQRSAADAFISGHDDIAEELRRLLSWAKAKRDAAGHDLDCYIKESVLRK